ncbi:hypothetical protein JKF63_04412 [Porcisia hertigi]|uniref:Pre-mRNA-splicing factor 18 n=1 Tax=Porcisia hertigi TaxID=2761500 RepID=A0A836LE80_9TRYP|nr:hypothetical protein JKF63_04412 [Porcisia hertigi]
MSFEGLQGLLKRKKTEHHRQQQVSSDGLSSAAAIGINSLPHPPALPENLVGSDKSATATTIGHVTTTTTTTTTSSSSSSAHGESLCTTSDPYATVLQRVQALQQQEKELCNIVSGPKRSRENMVPESNPGEDESTPSTGPSCSQASVMPNATPSVCASAVLSTSLNAPVAPSLKDDDAVLAQREMGVAVLQMCLTQLEHSWLAERASIKIPVPVASRRETVRPPANSSLERSVSVAASSVFPIPGALRDYLSTHNLGRSPVAARATGVPEMTALDREFELLAQLKAELETVSQNETTDSVPTAGAEAPRVPEEQRHLFDLLRALWYLIALLWQHSLDPHQHGDRGHVSSTAVPREGSLVPTQRGWSPVVYRAIQNALPADVRLLQGRAIADEVDRWRALARTRRDALELLSYVCSDYETSLRLSSLSTTTENFIIPLDLRKNLHTMVVRHLQQERNFMAVRQDYVDMTMGTANWKLGLFSGGEVHMRRSMERVERNRIAHLLNNEHATHLLQAVRELTIFVEQQAVAKRASFFWPEKPTSVMTAE